MRKAIYIRSGKLEFFSSIPNLEKSFVSVNVEFFPTAKDGFFLSTLETEKFSAKRKMKISNDNSIPVIVWLSRRNSFAKETVVSFRSKLVKGKSICAEV